MKTPANDSLHPTEGVRLLLERTAVKDGDAGATYDAAIYTVDAVFRYEATLELGGGAELVPADTRGPTDAETKLLNLAKSTARAAQRKQAEGLAPWPPRLVRWRL